MKFSIEDVDIGMIGRLVQEFFGEAVEEIARETGLVQRRSPLTGTKMLQVLVMGFLREPRASLRRLAMLCAELGVHVRPQALDERINAHSVAFMKALFDRGLALFRNQIRLPLEKLATFTQMNLVDSSVISLPEGLATEYPGCGGGGPQASLKIQLVVDFLRGNVEQITLQSGRSTDQAYKGFLEVVQPQSLTLMDLGYYDLDTFEAFNASAAYYLTRYCYPTSVFSADGTRVDLLQLLRTTETEIDIPVQLGSEKRLPARLVAVRAPQEVGDGRRRRLREKVKRGKRKPYTRQYLAMQDWTLWVTNLSPDAFTSAQVRQLYRVRWQIELVFKLWKSHCGIRRTDLQRRERILTELYAKLLGALLCYFLVAPLRVPHDDWQGREISVVQARKLLGDFARSIAASLNDLPQLIAHLDRFFTLLCEYGCLDKRRSRPNCMQRLVSVGLA